MKKRCAFTLIELLVVVAIIAVLVAILLPSMAAARNRAQTMRCTTNLRTIYQATAMYATENHDRLPFIDDYGIYAGYANFQSSPWGIAYIVRKIMPYVAVSAESFTWEKNPNQSMVFCCPFDNPDDWVGFEGKYHGSSYDFGFQYQGLSLDTNPVASTVEKDWAGWPSIWKEVPADQAPLWFDFMLTTYHPDGGRSVAFFDGHVQYQPAGSNWWPAKYP